MLNEGNIGCFIAILMIIGVLIFAGYECDQESFVEQVDPQKFDIEQVMEHNVGSYSVKYKKGGNELCEFMIHWQDFNHVKVVTDVPDGQPMFITLDQGRRKNGEISYHGNAIIHIHSAKDINGGGWDHGKQGKGQTVVVE